MLDHKAFLALIDCVAYRIPFRVVNKDGRHTLCAEYLNLRNGVLQGQGLEGDEISIPTNTIGSIEPLPRH